jgi:hypothetical protein
MSQAMNPHYNGRFTVHGGGKSWNFVDDECKLFSLSSPQIPFHRQRQSLEFHLEEGKKKSQILAPKKTEICFSLSLFTLE